MDALRAFVRAARTLSFKRAAAELHLSPSALSRRIQSLEEHLGTPLFRRLNPGLELTEAGARYREGVEPALARLEAAQSELLPASPGSLRLSALPSFSESWLVPHLPEFEGAHPEIQIELEATLRYADFERDPVDVAIRFGAGPWDGLHSEPIVTLEFFPVCAPALLAGDAPLRTPADLAGHTLIHLSQVPDAWRAWLRRAGHGALVPLREVRYDHVAIALSAAESGQGVALVSPLLCEQRLREGRLCRPFDVSVTSEPTYHFVCRPGGLEDARIRALRDWLVERLA
jgi:LysR family transcriptional regulator, glycine cleavage system transcriptional activator